MSALDRIAHIATKSLIEAELETLKIVLMLAIRNHIPDTHPFMRELLEYKKLIEFDLKPLKGEKE